MSKHVVAFLVRTADGNIDHDASVEKFASELSQYEKDSSVPTDSLTKIINDIFDENPGKPLTKFAQYVMTRVPNVTPGNQPYWERAIKHTLDSMTGEYGEPGAVIYSSKGQGGGTFRWSEASPERIKASQDRQKKAAAG